MEWGIIPHNTLRELLVAPVLSSLADVRLITDLGHLLCLSEQLLGLVRISLLKFLMDSLYFSNKKHITIS